MLELIKELRHDIHKNAEKSLIEYRTQKVIIEFIKNKLNIKNHQIKICTETGLIIKLIGEGKQINDNGLNIMFRTELDGLPIKELNDLPYKSNGKYSHMCGHDGHIAMIIYGIYLIKKDISKIPKNCSISFLFQPGEEGYLGSVKQIKNGCLNNINEIYAIHNCGFDNIGDIFIKSGPVLTGCKKVKITFFGKGGHGSLKYELKNPVIASCEFNLKIENYYNNLNNKEKKLINVCFPKIKGSNICNIIPNLSTLEGYIRSLDVNLQSKIEDKMNHLVKEISKKYKLEYNIEIKEKSSNPVYNDIKLTNIITEILKNKFKNISDKHLPCLVSDDFSYFQKEIPGVYFLLANGNVEGSNIHGPRYNFNDDLIEIGGKI